MFEIQRQGLPSLHWDFLMTFIDCENHRRHQRTLVDCVVHLHPIDASIDDAERSQDCIAQDISASGMRIWVDRHYQVNSQALLTFECEKVGTSRVTSCVVTVVWADPVPVEDRWQVGVRFGDDDASHEIANALARGCAWCEKLTPEIAGREPPVSE